MRNERDNSELVKRFCVELEGELRAFLLGILRNFHDVEDAYQRTVVRAIEACDDVHPETVRGWLFRIALNEARAAKRSESLAKRKSVDWVELFNTSDHVTDEGLERLLSAEQRESLEHAVMRLPESQKEVVYRRIQLGQTFTEIASEMKRPLGSILTWMRRALISLREMHEIRQFDPEFETESNTRSKDQND